MLAFDDLPACLCDGLPRRELMRVGGLSSLGLTLPHLWAAQQASAAPQSSGIVHAPSRGRAKSCIVLFLLGGPPQHETWDPKPDAPVEVRGDLQPIASATPGLNVGELMPKTARLTDKIAVLRAVSSRDNAHSSSGYAMLTGMPHLPLNVEGAKPGAPNDRPCLGAIVQKFRASTGALPGSVRLPEEIWNTGGKVWPGQDAGFLESSADPWYLFCDPNQPDFHVPGVALPKELSSIRAAERQTLLTALNRRATAPAPLVADERWSKLTERAFDLISARRGGEAFDLSRETDAMRDRYGRNRFGQSVLLARRLVEAGVSLVQVNWTRWATDTAASPGWDNHTNNAERLKTVLMPPMDQAYSALLTDLADRGLLDETLVVWMGEFGRSPKINKNAGRDHWGAVYSTALAGGGVRGGQVLGASDALGGQPKDAVVSPSDFAATILHALGVPTDGLLHDRLGRPMPVCAGRVIDGVL
jgi:hypothetical protein